MVCVFHVRIGQSERNGEENVTKQLRKRSYRIGQVVKVVEGKGRGGRDSNYVSIRKLRNEVVVKGGNG